MSEYVTEGALGYLEEGIKALEYLKSSNHAIVFAIDSIKKAVECLSPKIMEAVNSGDYCIDSDTNKLYRNFGGGGEREEIKGGWK